MARLEYELAYYNVAVHLFNHYITRTPPWTGFTTKIKALLFTDGLSEISLIHISHKNISTSWNLNRLIQSFDPDSQVHFPASRCKCSRGIPRSVVANVLDSNHVVGEFEIQLHYYVQFPNNTLGKIMTLLIPLFIT